jgi:hypothetical protein
VNAANEQNIKIAQETLGDQLWRLNNLYYIIDKAGQRVKFIMNDSQQRLYNEMWYRTTILKARQRGFTTFLDIFALDSTLFNDNYMAGIIAHNLPDAQKIFRTKVKYPYDNLPDWARMPIKVERAGEWEFENGSMISVSTSYRSGTLQFLHVSEMGKIAAKYPEKAVEIVTGAFEAVPIDGMIMIESTAEGRAGKFFDIVEASRKLADSGKKPNKLDFTFFFEPWWRNNEYQLDDPDIVINARMNKYFNDLSRDHKIELSPEQETWYVSKERTLGDDMKREYPSTPDEAFEASMEGAYFRHEMAKTRRDGRITKVPHLEGRLVTTWWDIGRDTTSIWFTQDDGMYVNVINYYQNAGHGLPHYKRMLDELKEELGYRYGPCKWPHDMGNEDWGDETTKEVKANNLGMTGDVLPRMNTKEDGIEAGRDFFTRCRFDEEKCSDGIDGLDSYRKQWDDNYGVWKDQPLHDWASHPADAYQQLALYHTFNDGITRKNPAARAVVTKPAGGWT